MGRRALHLVLVWVSLSGTLALAQNSGGSIRSGGDVAAGNGIAPAVTLTSVTIAPTNPAISSGATQQFSCTANFSDGSTVIVTNSAAWSSGNPAVATVNASGLATAVSAGSAVITCSYTFSLVTRTDNTTLTVNAVTVSSVAITPASVTLNLSQTQQFTCLVTFSDASTANCVNTAIWTTDNAGIATVSPTGLVMPESAGTAHITATFQSVVSNTGTVTVVNTAPGADNRYCLPGDIPNFGAAMDHVAFLPTACYYTARAATPSSGATHTVCVSGCDFTTVNAAYAAALCGETVQVKAQVAGVQQIYPTNLSLTKNCDPTHYLTIVTDQLGALPAEGTRATPCYIGLASLPGRPAYPCTSPVVAMPQLITNVVNTPVVDEGVAGASYHRFIGLEITTNSAIQQTQLTRMGTNGANHIIFDQLLIHGPELPSAPSAAGANQIQAAVTLSSNYLAVIDSSLYNTYCLSTQSCIDSQAISGGIGGNAQIGIKIVDDFLESAGESFIFGGAGATVTPSDIEIRRNHSFKPLQWRCDPTAGCPAGGHVIIKNLGEFKNAKRILAEGNYFDTVWQGRSNTGAAQSDQIAFSVLLTPKNQSGACPICTVTDLTMRYNWHTHSAQGVQLATALSTSGAASLGIHRISFHDFVFEDVNGPTWFPGACCGIAAGFQVSCSQTDQTTCPSDVWIQHGTMFLTGLSSGGGFGFSQNQTGAPLAMPNFTWRDNIAAAPWWQIAGNTTLFTGATTALNAQHGSSWCYEKNIHPTSMWVGEKANTPYPGAADNPAGGSCFGGTNQSCSGSGATCTPTSYLGVGFVNYNGGNGGDYHLALSSPYKNGGSDGQDQGANIDLVLQAISGVQ